MPKLALLVRWAAITGASALLGLSCADDDAIPSTSVGGSASEGSTSTTGTSGTVADSTGGSGGSGSGGADSSAGTSAASSEGSTTGEPCRVDADCDDDNDCTDDHCGAAGCTHAPIHGQPAPVGQIDGDCQVEFCVNGTPTPANSDNDLPDDGNVCTDDVCNMGVGSNPDSPAGTPCNGVGVCDGMGACSECISPDDCDQLPVDDECQQRTCESNTCGQVFTELDTPLSIQQPGDCHLQVCDGEGGVTAGIDDTDLPVDGLECTSDTCDDGVPANDPLPPGSPCAAGVCDGLGGCVGCVDASDCNGQDSFCRAYLCQDGACTVADTASGTVLPAIDQADNDCQVMVCDGNGNAVAIADTDDIPLDDGNDCTEEVCNGTLPDHADLPIDTDCNSNGGTFCDGAGSCVGCNDASQCPAAGQCHAATCENNVCGIEVTANVACNDGLFCTATDTCNVAGVCVGSGTPCNGPDGDSNCSESCDENANNCLGNDPSGAACSDGLFCTTGDVCDGNGTCQGGGNPCAAFVGDNDTDCSESCNEGTDSCTANDPNGSSCNDSLFCTVTDTCTNGVCGGTGNPCTANVGDNDSDCSESCNEVTNACTSNDPNGSSCNDGLFCTVTDTCTGGVCGGAGNPCTVNVGDNDTDCSESCNEVTNNCTSNDPNGSHCNDGLFCTVTDTCTGGVCGGTGNPCSGADGDNNCSESCNETLNNCSAADPNGSSCADGLFCTSGDACQGGTCVGGSNPCPGPDGDTDCSETCNETLNNCSTNDPNGSACDVSCFIDGSCLNGGCVTVCP
ncbi:MAG: hypothetical protein IPH07_23055 [Deltaproteobacteria bacterium]|nr:hypothetical protein [Deltaproteobacteria bacterium]MBP7285605.1 hypothetical protein [Nannocystaceae bacterium]